MKNGKHTIIRLIRSIRGQKKQTYSLPFREGSGVGFSPRQAQLILKISVSGVPGVPSVSGVSFRFWTKKTPVFGPNRNKTGVSAVSAVSSVPHPYSLPFREGPGVGFSLSPSAKRG